MNKVAKSFRMALLQLKVSLDRERNVANTMSAIRNVCKESKPKLVVLPEFFTFPPSLRGIRKNCESIPNGSSCEQLSAIAQECGIYLIGGTIPEQDANNKKIIYNTCTVWSPSGDMIGKYRKVHLFDVDIKNGITLHESEVITAGNQLTTVDMDEARIGFGICYDIRFDQMARAYRDKGCNMIIYPGAFNMVTGPLHWDCLLRSRAIDNQVFVVGLSAASNKDLEYVAYANSIAVDPWGKTIAKADHDEKVMVVDVDLSVVDAVREQIPIYNQRRLDVYDRE